MHGILRSTLSCLRGIRMDSCSRSDGLPKTENIVAMHSSTDSTLLLCPMVSRCKNEQINSPKFKTFTKHIDIETDNVNESPPTCEPKRMDVQHHLL